MNLNLLSYALFFPTMVYIAVKVAQTCHRHGAVWMMRIFHGDQPFVNAVNNVLLVGCYTVNIGYVALVITTWEPVTGSTHMLAVLSERIAWILFSLAGLHYTNITVLLLWARITRARHAAPPPQLGTG